MCLSTEYSVVCSYNVYLITVLKISEAYFKSPYCNQLLAGPLSPSVLAWMDMVQRCVSGEEYKKSKGRTWRETNNDTAGEC